MQRGWRLLIVLLGAAAAVALFIVLRDDESRDDAAPTAPAPQQTVMSIQPPPPPPSPRVVQIDAGSGGIERATVRRGEQVVLVVNGPPGEEVHFHGYDITRAVGPRGRAYVAFRATIPGRFEVELHGSQEQIGDVTVR